MSTQANVSIYGHRNGLDYTQRREIANGTISFATGAGAPSLRFLQGWAAMLLIA
jgi:hypothetical protein